MDEITAEAITRGIAALPGLIRGAEDLFGKGTGEQKRQAVTRDALAIIGTQLQPGMATSPLESAITDTIAGVVSTLNATIWKKQGTDSASQNAATAARLRQQVARSKAPRKAVTAK